MTGEHISRRSVARLGLLALGTALVLSWEVTAIVSPSPSWVGEAAEHRIFDAGLRLAMAIFAVIVGAWALVLPGLLRPWREILRTRA